MSHRRFRSALRIVAIVAWSLGLVVGVAWTGTVIALGDLGCEHEVGDSNYGQLRWSLAPPGRQCEWTKAYNDVDASDGPGWVPSVWLVGILGGVAYEVCRRRSSRSVVG